MTCSVAATKPSIFPPAHWMWLAHQLWVGTPSCCTVDVAW